MYSALTILPATPFRSKKSNHNTSQMNDANHIVFFLFVFSIIITSCFVVVVVVVVVLFLNDYNYRIKLIKRRFIRCISTDPLDHQNYTITGLCHTSMSTTELIDCLPTTVLSVVGASFIKHPAGLPM